MSRICLMGSSHLAALQVAYRGMPESERPDADFFGAPGLQLAHLRRKGTRLVSKTDATREWLRTTSGGQDAIDPDAYQAFVLVDLGLSYVETVANRSQVRLADEPPSAATLISPALLNALVPDRIARSVALSLAGEVAGSGRQIVVIPGPRPTRAICDRRQHGPYYRDLKRVSELQAEFEASLQHICAERNITVVLQPPHTRDGPFSLEDHAIEAPRTDLQGPLPENEFLHMNGAYGLEIWKLVRTALAR